jgi:hypothetical protein
VLQAAIQKEREATQALMAAKEKEMEERTARLLEEERARSDASYRAIYELFVVRFFFIFVKSCI